MCFFQLAICSVFLQLTFKSRYLYVFTYVLYLSILVVDNLQRYNTLYFARQLICYVIFKKALGSYLERH